MKYRDGNGEDGDVLEAIGNDPLILILMHRTSAA